MCTPLLNAGDNRRMHARQKLLQGKTMNRLIISALLRGGITALDGNSGINNPPIRQQVSPRASVWTFALMAE